MRKQIVLMSLLFVATIPVFFSCNRDIEDMPANPVTGKWMYSHFVESSAEGEYGETEEAVARDLQNRWSEVEAGAFTYEFTTDGKFLYNGEPRGKYTFTGSGLILINEENGKYVDEGSFQFGFEGNQLLVRRNLASEYRDENNRYANAELLKSLGVTVNPGENQLIYGAWVKLAFDKVEQ